MEPNAVRKNPMRVAVRLAYAYPSYYSVMASSLSHDIIYFMANSREDVYMERFCLDCGDGPRSMETGSRLSDFDAILATLHYELDAANLVKLLEASGLSPFAKERAVPLIVGGPVAMANPAPLSEIADAFVIGEAEATLGAVIDAVAKRAGDKRGIVEELSSLPFVYAPEAGGTAKRKYVEDLDAAFYPVRQLFDPERPPAFGLGFKLEASRGCPFWCSFCLESRLFYPFRHRSPGRLRELADAGLEANGLDRVIVYSLSFPAHPADRDLLEHLASRGARASLPSMRLDKIDRGFLELVRSVGQREVSLAPETFSPLLQRVYSKYPGVARELAERVEEVLEAGFDVKLYLVYGAKGERLEDVEQTAEALLELRRRAKERGRKLAVSLNPLVPKARTPFAHLGMRAAGELRALLRVYRERLGKWVEARALSIREAEIQAAISLGGPGLGRAIVAWARLGGGLGAWPRALRATGVSVSYVYRGLDPGEDPPWSMVDLGGLEKKVSEAQLRAIREVLGLRG